MAPVVSFTLSRWLTSRCYVAAVQAVPPPAYSASRRLATPAPTTPTIRPRWPAFWTGSALLSLLALARWQSTEDLISLTVAGVALLAAIVSSRTLRAPRWAAVSAVCALAIALGVAVAETRATRDLEKAGEMWALAARNRDVARVALAIEEARTATQQAAAAALSSGVAVAPDVRGAETGLVLYEGATLVSRAGQSRVALTPGGDGLGFVQTAFHSALVARAQQGQRTAVATVLLTAAAPANRFARALVPAVVTPEIALSIRLDRPSALYPADPNDPTRRAVFTGTDGLPVLVVGAAPRSIDEARLTGLQRARVRTSVPLAVAALFILVVGWRRPARLRERLAVVGVLLLTLAFIPIGSLSNVSPLFNAANYFSPIAGPLTATIAAVTLSALLALLALFRVLRSTRLAESRRLAMALVVGIAVLGPFALRDLARGIAFPPSGPSVGLWVAWQLAIAMAAAGILIAGASAGQVVIRQGRGLPSAIGPVIAAAAAVTAPVLWQAPGVWPAWYPLVWIFAIACLAFVRRGRGLVTAVAFVAGCGAVTLTWGATTRTRMQLAEADVPALTAPDSSAYLLLSAYADALSRERSVPQRARLLETFAASDLAQAGYPARLALWTADSPQPITSVTLTTITDELGVQRELAEQVRGTGASSVVAASDGPFTISVAAIPWGSDTVATVAVPPRTWLLPPDPFARLTGLAATPDRAPPYQLSLASARAGVPDSLTEHVVWARRGAVMVGDARVGTAAQPRRAHVEVELRGLDALLPRGALLVLLDVAVVLLVWAASAMADGGLWRWLRWQRSRWRRSYRSRLSIALLAFFLAPAAAFAAWEAYRLREDDRSARELLVREALRSAELPATMDSAASASLLTTRVMADVALDVGGPLFAYRDGVLAQASDEVLAELAPFGTLLPADVPAGVEGNLVRLDANGDAIVTRLVPLVTRSALVGFRPTVGPEGMSLVLATAARGDEFLLDARRADLAILVMLLSVSGVAAALWLSGVAARQLARPIGTLRDAALAIASGRPMPPLDAMPPAEFVPVFGAFARMATDLSTSRAALEEAQRRTSAVLHEVASGVVAIRHDGTVLLANPRAELLLGATLSPGTSVVTGGAGTRALGAWPAVAGHVREFMERGDRAIEAFDVQLPAPARVASGAVLNADGASAGTARQVRASLTRLPGGAVLTLDDVTELASAQRVLAWGEMARQVAHEIKNPLTPIRLGVQHLRRAWRDGRTDFGDILDTNVTRILGEIDRLDEIARAFSRYGGAPAERAPGEPVDVARVARDVVGLERMGEDDVTWLLTIDGEIVSDSDAEVAPILGVARADELREVLLNLLENARLADARTVHLQLTREQERILLIVEDDGAGMPAEVLPHIFQPHFSTRTSGSGLGLAISRRLLEGWGGSIGVASEAGRGTTLTVALLRA